MSTTCSANLTQWIPTAAAMFFHAPLDGLDLRCLICDGKRAPIYEWGFANGHATQILGSAALVIIIQGAYDRGDALPLEVLPSAQDSRRMSRSSELQYWPHILQFLILQSKRNITDWAALISATGSIARLRPRRAHGRYRCSPSARLWRARSGCRSTSDSGYV